MALSGLLVWIIGNQLSGNLIQTRYYFSIFPAFCALAAAGERGLRGLRLGSVRLGRISATLIALGLLLNTLTAGLEAYKQGAPQVALGLKSGEAYLGDVLGWYLPAMQAVRALPEGSLVQMIYEPRSLYCSPWCRPDEILDTWKRARLAGHDDPTAIRQAWRAQGFSHLLVSTIGINFWREAGDPNHTPEDILSLTQFLATLPRPVDYGGAYALYSIQ